MNDLYDTPCPNPVALGFLAGVTILTLAILAMFAL